ncbi:AraC family transcriptional regulator [Tropicimonas isoalkanivorans]|uniref:AraC-type DNA-binding protein n=1 Tax=Tropicimonas isoalkanivorans TaxID=441112 RepID=A0A1I1IM09_9RHOB|nr:AraC family transcriptional regulator [Tropicimonas isoalkanivorans]SFC34823.1 AraC-type DNA-binding protein [Tropicimonas isoalkanivorans]
MQPDLELVHIRKGESFAAWQHGYPFRTVRWHYHPEYEIHLVVETSGKYYIGDHIGRFAPGQLVMTGPNLPQNWLSDVPENVIVPRRSQVIQFRKSFIDDAREVMPEFEAFQPLLEKSRRGLLFDHDTGMAAMPIMAALMEAKSVRRLSHFCDLVDLMLAAPEPQILASLSFQKNMDEGEDKGINRAIAHLRDNLLNPMPEKELASMTGQSRSAFSRSFKRHTGTTLVRYKNQLRVDLACHMLLSDPDAKVADICFDVGFSNLSNFNRQFFKLKGMSPSEFRTTFAANKLVRMTG